VNLISIYGRLGRLDKAEEHYRAAVRLNPNHAESHYDFGVLLFGLGKHAEAEQAFRRALDIDPFHPEAHNNLAYLFEQQGKLAEAKEHYRKAIENKPDYRLAHFHLGRILVNEKRFREGIEHLLKTLTPEDESTPGYLYALGAAYGRAGDRQNALRYLHTAREQASQRGQSRLLSSIERDLRVVEGGRP
jgi:tetratricopeptide (TPR) repeat protein